MLFLAANNSAQPAQMLSFMVIISIIGFVFLIISIVMKIIEESKKRKREEKLNNIAKLSGDTVKPLFNKPLKDGAEMTCFTCLQDPSFINVLEKKEKDNGDIYIGELEWIKPIAPYAKGKGRNRYDFYADAKMGMDSSYDRQKYYATMCVCYHNGFNLPNFDLTKETLDKKAAELFKMNETEDIDFDEDNDFSDAWWLSSSENEIVRELFTSNIRSNFMRFCDKNYKICGQKNMVMIITNHVIQPEDYPNIITDMLDIINFLKTNNKFYNEEAKKTQEVDKKLENSNSETKASTK